MRRARAVVWAVMAAALAVALWAAARPAPASLDARTRAVAADVRCPSCSALSAADSNAPTAVAVRALIRQQLADGRSPAQVDQQLVARYGGDILLRPPARGVDVAVWAVPAVVAAAALAAGTLAFRRWRSAGVAAPDESDEALVAEALRSGT